MKINELIDSYLSEIESIRRYSQNTIKSYKTDLNEFLEYCNDNDRLELAKITERFLKTYLMILNEKELDKRSISRKLAAIRSLYKFAFQKNYIEENPVAFIQNPKSIRKLPEVLSTNLILETYKLADESEEKPEIVKAIFELLYGCALRASELCDLKISDLNKNKMQLKVLGKGNKTRIIPIGDKSLVVINDYLEKNPVISNNDYLIRTKKK